MTKVKPTEQNKLMKYRFSACKHCIFGRFHRIEGAFLNNNEGAMYPAWDIREGRGLGNVKQQE